MKVEVCEDQSAWDALVLERGGHPLQLWGWGEVKAAHNWQVERLIIREDQEVVGLCQLLLRPLPGPFGPLAYVPRGPVVTITNEKALETLSQYVKSKHRAVVLTIEPDQEGQGEIKGWRRSPNPILLARTLVLDILKNEDELLAAMTKKTRQYIRKSANTGVEVVQVSSKDELATCLEIYKQTAARAGFSLHEDAYYVDIFKELGEHSPVYVARYEGRVVAFLWLAVSKDTAFELYGGMSEEGQQLRANFILKWEVIRQMKARGVRRYDMNGLLNDGVSQFKQGFASHETLLIGSYDKPLSPLYGVWAKGLPFAKTLIRKMRNR